VLVFVVKRQLSLSGTTVISSKVEGMIVNPPDPSSKPPAYLLKP